MASNGVNNSAPVYKKRSSYNEGDTILNGKYTILRSLHSSGMANVYVALDVNLGKQWCVKEIRKSEAGRKNIEHIGLLQEANILRDLSNERIPRITEIATEGDSLIVVMDFLDGVNLKDFIERNGKVDEDLAVKWMIQITQTMTYLHSKTSKKKPVFYRDMKPDNLMVRPNGNINIFDFGISIKVESEDQLPELTLGTKGYVAPEQKKRDLPVDLRSDIYAMGKTFYFMVTGVDPRSFGDNELKPISDWSPEISPALIKIIEKCMEPDANDRFQDCEELQYALENYRTSDEKYRSTAVKKITITVAVLMAGILIMWGSVVPFSMVRAEKEDAYTNAVLVAQQSGKAEDYYTAISLNPLDIDMYVGFISAVENDGEFSKEEEKMLLDYLNTNLVELKEAEDYGRLAYEIGRLYWFYYDDYNEDEEGKTISIKWFEDSIAAGCNVEESTVYHDLGIFKRDIAKSIKDSSDSGMYKTYWGNLLKAQEVTTNDLVTIQTYLSASECISVYAYNLKKDGITYEDIMKEVSILQYFIDNYDVEGSSDMVKELYNELSSTVSGLEPKVNTVFSKAGGDD